MDVAGVTMQCRKCKKQSAEGTLYDDFIMVGGAPKTLIEVFICRGCLDAAIIKREGEYGKE